jgi:hypothetical protein
MERSYRIDVFLGRVVVGEIHIGTCFSLVAWRFLCHSPERGGLRVSYCSPRELGGHATRKGPMSELMTDLIYVKSKNVQDQEITSGNVLNKTNWVWVVDPFSCRPRIHVAGNTDRGSDCKSGVETNTIGMDHQFVIRSGLLVYGHLDRIS